MILKDHPNDIFYRKILKSEERNCKRYKRLAYKISAFDKSKDSELF
jgi:tRNA isopentenyl-2-thiomethyl-A-37 hydroxylase MiaE